MERNQDTPLPQHRSHSRNWRENLYVYPVMSRRSRGLSIGINLNPDMACNFDCVYCQVDRTVEPKVRHVDLDVLRAELDDMIALSTSGELWQEQQFRDVPDSHRRLNDIAFSGDGEPTTCTQFLECVELVSVCKRAVKLDEVKIVLITDACYLTRRNVVAGLVVMDNNNGEIWAKLDAGTQDYYRKVNRPNYPLRHVVDNIIDAAMERPVVIQSLFMRLDGDPPSRREISEYVSRLSEIAEAGGEIDRVQIYTIARRPAESFATPLSRDELEAISQRTQQGGFKTETYEGAG